jgi:hypothetical protein
MPDFSWYNIPKQEKMYQMTTQLPNAHKIYPMAVIYSQWPENITTLSIPVSSKIYPNLEIGSEKKPSGNPAVRVARVPIFFLFNAKN